MKIRACTIHDEDLWIQLNQEFMAYELTDSEFWNHPDRCSETSESLRHTFREALKMKEHIRLLFLEYEAEGTGTTAVAGFANLMTIFSVWAHGKAMILDDLYLRDSARGKGLGTSFMHFLEEYGRENGYQRLQFQSEFSNPAAHQFYTRLGYRSQDMHFYVKALM